MIYVNEPILVVKMADIGDAVLALPAVQALRAGNPHARIDVLTTHTGANVFSRSPAVDDVIVLDKQRFDRIQGLISPAGIADLARLTARLRRRRYRTVIILHHLTTQFGTRKFRALVRATGAPAVAGLDNGRGTFLTHRAQDYGFGAVPEWKYGLNVIEALGLPPSETRPKLKVDNGAQAAADERLTRAGINDEFVVIHPEVGEFSPARAWPDEHFAVVAHVLVRERGIPVVLVGTQPGRDGLGAMSTIPGVRNFVGQTSFSELCALIERASLVIGADSSVSHLAAAFDRPAISLFGPSNVAAWKPYGSSEHGAGQPRDQSARAVSLHLNLPCSPCIYTGFRLGRPQGCRSRACLIDLKPSEVIPSAMTILDRTT